MRSIKFVVASLAVATAMSIAVPSVEAGSRHRHRDRVYADSFGNLVIDSAAGYKRIIVGQGSQAKEMAKFLDAGLPPLVDYEGYPVDEDVAYEDDYRVFNNRGVFDNRGVFHNRGVYRNRGVFNN